MQGLLAVRKRAWCKVSLPCGNVHDAKSPCRAETCMLLRVSVQCVSLFRPLSVTGGFAVLVAVREKFLHCNFSQKSERSWSSARKKMQECFLFIAWAGCQLQRGMFVVLTAYAGFLGNDRYMDGSILKLFYRTYPRSTDRPTNEGLRKKLSDFRKSLHVQIRFVVRWGFREAGFGLLFGAT